MDEAEGTPTAKHEILNVSIERVGLPEANLVERSQQEHFMTETNSQIRLAARPRGEIKADDWEHVTVPIEKPARVSLRAGPASSP